MSADDVAQQRSQVIGDVLGQSTRAGMLVGAARDDRALERESLDRTGGQRRPALGGRAQTPPGARPAARSKGPRAPAAPAARGDGRSAPPGELSRSQPSSNRRSAQATSFRCGARRETRLQNARSSSSCSAVTTSMPWGRPPAPSATGLQRPGAHTRVGERPERRRARHRTAAVPGAGP